MTAWNVVFAVLLVLLVFGWTNGRALVKSSYDEAKDRARQRRNGGKAPAAHAEPGQG
jgi:hypothetical protein